MKSDYTTWCNENNKCGVDLSKILNELNNDRITSKVNSHYSKFTDRLSSLNKLNRNKLYFMTLLLHEIIKSIKKYKYPINVETRLLNLIRIKYRQNIKNKFGY